MKSESFIKFLTKPRVVCHRKICYILRLSFAPKDRASVKHLIEQPPFVSRGTFVIRFTFKINYVL